MARFYYVDPSAQSQSPLPAIGATVGGPYLEGATVTLPSGQTVYGVQQIPSAFLYEAILDPDPPREPVDYYTSTTNLYFVANADPLLERVQEEEVYSEKSLASAQTTKRSELDTKADEVDEQGLDVSGMQAGTVAVQTIQRARNFYASFQLGEVWPGVTTVRRVNQFGVWYGHTKDDCVSCNEQLPIYHDAVLSANYESLQDQIDTARTVDEVIAVDIDSGWPPAPTPAGQMQAQTDEVRAAALLQIIWSDPDAAPEIRGAGDPGRAWLFLMRSDNRGKTIAQLRVKWAQGNGGR